MDVAYDNLADYKDVSSNKDMNSIKNWTHKFPDRHIRSSTRSGKPYSGGHPKKVRKTNFKLPLTDKSFSQFMKTKEIIIFTCGMNAVNYHCGCRRTEILYATLLNPNIHLTQYFYRLCHHSVSECIIKSTQNINKLS